MLLERYEDQVRRWPRSGRHILSHHDAETVVVYQAYRPSIARWALAHGRLGGPEFSLSRMSWIKPNFLWMMYRCGWGMKDDQQAVLGLRVERSFFDRVLRGAVASAMDPARFADADDWRHALSTSNVRLQWDPDHDPSGAPVQRRAIQLGLRGAMLAALAEPPCLVEIIDMTPIVEAGRPLAGPAGRHELVIPSEHVYEVPEDAALAIGLDRPGPQE
jgi:hypothetical protein